MSGERASGQEAERAVERAVKRGDRPSEPRDGAEQRRHSLAEIARRAVEAFVAEDRIIPPEAMPADLPARAGVFVTIRERGGLRGCVGSIEPTQPSLAEEVIRSATLAATDDPRFLPVQPDELRYLSYEVSVLGEPERIGRLDDLDPRSYGVIVSAGVRRGLLLPGIPGIDAPEEQVRIARQKAGIGPRETVELYRFRTQHFE